MRLGVSKVDARMRRCPRLHHRAAPQSIEGFFDRALLAYQNDIDLLSPVSVL
jgi:hypothetical protein